MCPILYTDRQQSNRRCGETTTTSTGKPTRVLRERHVDLVLQCSCPWGLQPRAWDHLRQYSDQGGAVVSIFSGQGDQDEFKEL